MSPPTAVPAGADNKSSFGNFRMGAKPEQQSAPQAVPAGSGSFGSFKMGSN